MLAGSVHAQALSGRLLCDMPTGVVTIDVEKPPGQTAAVLVYLGNSILPFPALPMASLLTHQLVKMDGVTVSSLDNESAIRFTRTADGAYGSVLFRIEVQAKDKDGKMARLIFRDCNLDARPIGY